MRHLYRFVEPVILFLLKTKGQAYGYDLAGEVRKHAFTDAAIERAALYRTLRQLEDNGLVSSDWSVQPSGPARRIYSLTSAGEQHLEQWAGLLTDLSGAMVRFVGKIHTAIRKEKEAKAASDPVVQPVKYPHETITR